MLTAWDFVNVPNIYLSHFQVPLTAINVQLSKKKALLLFLELENSMRVDGFLSVHDQTYLAGNGLNKAVPPRCYTSEKFCSFFSVRKSPDCNINIVVYSAIP